MGDAAGAGAGAGAGTGTGTGVVERTREDGSGNGGAVAAGEDNTTTPEAQAAAYRRAPPRPKRAKPEGPCADGVTIRTTLRLDQFPTDWWTHLVRYFKMVELVRLHLTCAGIRTHALPSKCLYIYLDVPYQLRWLQECQDSVERVTSRFCDDLYDPTQVVARLGTCTSLKVWHFEQPPRGVAVRGCSPPHLTAPVNVVVSQLTQLRTFLQRQRRYVCMRDGG